MRFIIEVTGSCTAGKTFKDKAEAREYYQFLLIGYEFTKDFSTDVVLKQMDEAGNEKVILKRIPSEKALWRTWLSDL